MSDVIAGPGKGDGRRRSRWPWHQAFTVTALCALAVATVLAVTPAGAWLLGPPAGTPQAVTVTSQYTCDLAKYGYAGPPVSIVATAILPSAATAMTGFGALFTAGGPPSFSTSLVALPASVASRLADLSKLTLEATIPVRGTPAAAPVAKIWGGTAGAFLPTGPLTQLQVFNAIDTTFFSSPGTAWLEPPAQSLLFTPYRNGQPLPTISCAVVPGLAPVPPAPVTVTTAPSTPSAMSATATPAATPSPSATPSPTGPVIPTATAPVYQCGSTYRASPYSSPLPMAITASGVPRVGHQLTLTLWSPVTGLAAPAPSRATRLQFTGGFPVAGAQGGEVRLSETTANVASPLFTVSGRLRLTKPGTDRIGFPLRFVYTVYRQKFKLAVFTCTLTTSPAPVGLVVRVAPSNPANPANPANPQDNPSA